MREVLGGGSGGRYYADGEDTIHVVPDSRNLPTEFTEARFPFRVESLGLAVDSGGAGQYRGGLGYEKHIRMLKDAHFMSIADRSILACWGVKGGQAGRPFQVTIDPGGPNEREVDALADAEPVRAGEVIRIRTTGGGGWGDPLERDPALVVARRASGARCPPRRARADYGVVLTGSLDDDSLGSTTTAATARAERAGPPGATEPFFDRGPGLRPPGRRPASRRGRLALTPAAAAAGPVLVLGASGKTGRAVTRALTARGVRVRAAVRAGVAHRRGARRRGRTRRWPWTLGTGQGRAEASRGAAAVYHLAPNVHPDEVGMAERVCAAAERAAVRRLVFHSVLHPDDASMPHHTRKARAEDVVRATRLPWTVLRPAAYHQNLLGAALRGRIAVPHDLDAPFTNVDLGDVAEVAARALTGALPAGGTHELAGPETLSVRALAEVATDVLGRPVHAEQVPLEDWATGPAAASRTRPGPISPRCSGPYDAAGLVGRSDELTQLLGRTPTSWAQVLREADTTTERSTT